MAQDLRPASSGNVNISDAGDGFIEHHVSKLDTLAGVAIKYGVEVADVKRLNGLVSDFQMFAHKTLRIPVGRRHPASSTLIKSENTSLSGCPLLCGPLPNSNTQLETSNNQEKRVRDRGSLSLAMNLLRGYYGLSSPSQLANGNNTGMEMASFKAEAEEHSDDDEPFFHMGDVPITGIKNGYKSANGVHASKLNGRKVEWLSRSADGGGQMPPNEVLQTSIVGGADGSSNEKSVRRRFKTEAAITPASGGDDDDECNKRDTPAFDKVLPSSGLSGAAATTQSSSGLPVVILKVLDGALVSSSGKGKDSPVKGKKSPSTSNLQDPTSSKAEVRSGSQFSSRTSSDTPPKPVSYRFKAALD